MKGTSRFDLTGSVAVVVGGTSGIGRALAVGLADAGADVVATGRRRDLVESISAEIASAGRRTFAMPADVADAASLERLREETIKRLGKVDIMLIAKVTGYILEVTNSNYLIVFVMAGCMYLLALGIIHLLAPRLEPAKLS